MPNQVDPRYFNIGNAFLGGMEQAQDSQRKNAMLEMQQRQYGLQEQRAGREEQAYSAEVQQAEMARKARVVALKELDFDDEDAEMLSHDPKSGELILEARKMAQPKPPGQLYPVQGEGGAVYADAKGAMGKQPYIKPEREPQGPAGTWSTSEVTGPDGKPMRIQTNSVTGDERPAPGGYGPKPTANAKTVQTAKGKLITVALARKQLAQLRQKYDAAKDTLALGPGANLNPYDPRGKAFDAAVDSLRTTIRQLTRTAGEGAMSDWEGRMAQAQLPERGELESASAQKIDQIDDMLSVIDDGYKNMLGDSPAAVPADGGGNVIDFSELPD